MSASSTTAVQFPALDRLTSAPLTEDDHRAFLREAAWPEAESALMVPRRRRRPARVAAAPAALRAARRLRTVAAAETGNTIVSLLVALVICGILIAVAEPSMGGARAKADEQHETVAAQVAEEASEPGSGKTNSIEDQAASNMDEARAHPTAEQQRGSIVRSPWDARRCECLDWLAVHDSGLRKLTAAELEGTPCEGVKL